MAALGEMFPGRKLEHDGDEDGSGQGHEPEGPLDLESGVVFLAPRTQPGASESEVASEE